jgi:hypothetical protein
VPGARITVGFHPDRLLGDGKHLWHILVLRGHPRKVSSV